MGIMKIRVVGKSSNIHTWKFEDAETGNIIPVSSFTISGDVRDKTQWGIVQATLRVDIDLAEIEVDGLVMTRPAAKETVDG